ncbi:HU family DNA-binding protein [Alloprevotella tannerae]
MIKFVIRAKKNPLKKDQVKFYPQMASGVPVMLRTIVGRIEKRSGVSSASVKAVLDALQYEVLQTLSDGNSVRLGDLGSFRLTMHGEGASTAKQAKEKGANLIKRVSVRFTKSSAMRLALDKRNITFGAQEDIRNAK